MICFFHSQVADEVNINKSSVQTYLVLNKSAVTADSCGVKFNIL